MKPYQRPPSASMEPVVLPATEYGRGPPQRGGSRLPGPVKSRPNSGIYAQSAVSISGSSVASSAAFPVPAPRTAGLQQQQQQPGPGNNNSKIAKPTARYYPSLSGSETDVSTSTENLTQEERYVLRHMERQDPQGEENGDPLAALAHMNRSVAASMAASSHHHHHQQQQHQMQMQMQMQQHQNLPPMSTMDLQMQMLQQRQRMAGMPHMVNSSSPRPIIDSPGNAFASMPRSLHEELWSHQQTQQQQQHHQQQQQQQQQQQRLQHHRGVAAANLIGSPMVVPGALSPMIAGPSVASTTAAPVSAVTSSTDHLHLAAKLNPSVYSHPSVQDPVLNNSKTTTVSSSSYQDYLPLNRDLAVLSGRRGNVDVTSSGAFFDPRAVSKAPKQGDLLSSGSSANHSSTDIISQLTREMKLQQQTAAGGMLSGSSDAVSTSSGGSANQLNQLAAQPPPPSSTTPATTNNNNGLLTSTAAASSPSATSIINKLNLSPAKMAMTGNKAGTIASDLANQDCLMGVVERPKVKTTTSAAAATSRLSLVGTTPPSDKKAVDNLSLLLSRSQPDLFTGIDASPQSPTVSDQMTPVYANTMATTAASAAAVAAGIYGLSSHQASVNTTSSAAVLHQIETLKADNRDLKDRLNEYTKKVSRVSTLEQEMAKIHQAYQALLKHSEKRELLEKSARAKLQSVILNLSDANKEVTERHEAVMGQLMSGEAKNQNIPGLDAILRGEILRKDGLIRQLMDQNKQLLSAKERQEIEMAAQGETLEEQRAHIQILDTALSNAQAAVLRLEEENRLKEGYADRVKQMTRSLDQLQKASEKREAMEKKLRAKLEEELKELRSILQGGTGNPQRLNDNQEDLRRKLSECEEKVIRLESERTQWEQRYLEESAMRQVAIDAASIPKDAKIAALEKTSAESEKLIADARSDKMKQFEQMQNAQRKCAEMESMVKTLETTLAERNAMVRILQCNSSKTLAGGNLEDILNQIKLSADHHVSLATSATPTFTATPPTSLMDPGNVLSIAISNTKPHSKQLSTPNPGGVAAPPTYHSLTATPTRMGPKKNLLQGRSLTPSADMFFRSSGGGMPSTADIYRSATPSADLFRSSATPSSSADLFYRSANATPAAADLFRATPSSADIFRAPPPTSMSSLTVDPLKQRPHSGREMTPVNDMFHPGSTLINTADLYTPTLAGGPQLVGGGTMPKMSMLRDNNRSALSNKLPPGSLVNVSSSFLDDSIGSFLGPMTPTKMIDTNPTHSIRHEASKSYDGSKSYMEVWRV